MRKNWPLVRWAIVGSCYHRPRPALRIKLRPRPEGLEERHCPSLALTLGDLTGTVGTPYSQQISAGGVSTTDSLSYSLITPPGSPSRNGLPPGIALGATGLLSGTPTTPGAYDIVVAVADNTTGATAQEAFPLSISPLITLSASLANSSGTEDITLSKQTITAYGPAGDSYSFAMTGSLPPGVTLAKASATTAQLTGTPRQWGTYSFTVTATDDNEDVGVQTYELTIKPDITFSPAPIANLYTTNQLSLATFFLNDLPSVAVAGQAYSQTISASSVNGIASLTYSVSGGAPPSGLNITQPSANTLLISGTPTTFTQESAPIQIAVTANDMNGYSDTVDYLLDVEPNPASPYVAIQAEQTGSGALPDLPAGVVGQAYPSTTFATPPGSGTFTFSLVPAEYSSTGDGGVPPGMTFDATSDTLSGTPTQAGQYSLIIQAVSSTLGIIDSRVFHLTINPAPESLQLGPLTLPLASPDVSYSQPITAIGGTGTTTLTYSLVNGTMSDLTALGLRISQNPSQPNVLTLSGTPTASTPVPGNIAGSNGPLTLSVTATDSAGDSVTQQYPISIYYTPQQIRQAYGFDDMTLSGGVIGDGSGQTIAIIDQGDAPNLVSTSDPNFDNSDLHQFDLAFSLPDPPQFSKLDAYGGPNIPTTSSGFAGEITQDVEWVHALAPGASIILLEGASGDVFNSIQTARNLPGVTVVLMTFRKFFDNNADNGGVDYIEPDLDPLFVSPPNHPITFLASAGDTASGVSNGEFLDRYPAISPNVVSVGYTDLTLNLQGDYASEAAVFGAGGGASLEEPLPPWQLEIAGQVSTEFRANPDVTFNGSNQSSVAVFDTEYEATNSPWKYGDGTSIATSSWAALIAIADQARAIAGESPLDGPTQTLPDLYALAGSVDFNPVSTVTDGTIVSHAFGSYNPWAGLGSPVVSRLVPALVGNHDTISGTVYNDLDGIGVLTNSDPPLAGVTVYLDANNNGTLDPGETRTTTDAEGDFSFTVTPGSYTVRAVAPPGFRLTSSNPSTINFPASAASAQDAVDFGFQALMPTPPPPTTTPNATPTQSPTPAPTPTPTLPPPNVIGIAGVTHSKELTAITLAFDEALDSASVGNLALYSVLRGVKKHRKTVYSKPLAVTGAIYDGAANTVTIDLAKPYRRTVLVTVRSGVLAADGQSSSNEFSALVK